MRPDSWRFLVIGFALASATEASSEVPAMKMTTEIPSSITTPDQVETSIGTLEFFDGIPTRETADAVYDTMDRARAVQAYVLGLPLVSMESLKTGAEAVGSKAVNQFLIADRLLDSKPLVLTANTSTLYTWSMLDLGRDGPTVIDLPPGMLGSIFYSGCGSAPANMLILLRRA